MAVREDKDGKTPGAGECRGRQTRCKQPGPVQLLFCREKNEWHKPKGKGEPGAGGERSPILHPAWSCEGAPMPFSTVMLGGKSVALLGSLRREGKGEAGFAQKKARGSPLALLAIPPIAVPGTPGIAPSCCEWISKPSPAQPCSEGPAPKSSASSASSKGPSMSGEVWPWDAPAPASFPPSGFPSRACEPAGLPTAPWKCKAAFQGCQNPAALLKFLGALGLRWDASLCLCL